MLPEIGTAERDQLEAEAIDFGLSLLHDEKGDIPNTLYRVYMHFREKFIEERGLLDTTWDMNPLAWDEVRYDANVLRDYVSQCWATAVVREYDRKRSRY